MSDSDGVEETLEQVMRVAITAAARTGETAARRRQDQTQRLAGESEARARELQARADAEMEAARSAYAGVKEPAWWSTASPADVATAYESATAWADIDEAAAQAKQRIEDELRQRYGISETPDRGVVVEDGGRSKEAEVAPLVAAAERSDAASATGASWDTRERREESARSLRAQVGDERAVEAKMRADVAQAEPAAGATRGASQRASKARPARGGQRQRTRGLQR